MAIVALNPRTDNFRSADLSTTSPPTDGKKNSENADFNTFLLLLTTQLRNQDPLKPVESTEFVAQLASFSAVEQQVRTNEKLSEIANLLSSNAAGGYVEFVGQKVRAPIGAEWSGAPIDIKWTPLENAENSRLTVFDAADQQVAVRNLATQPASFSWDGIDQSGTTVNDGVYHFQIESFRHGELVDRQKGLVEATITGLQWENGIAKFLFADGTLLPASDFN